MSRRRLAAVLSGLLAVTAADAVAQQNYLFGAIAYSPSTRAIGVAADNTTQAEAESVALQNCRTAAPGATDCRNVMWVRNACAVLAIGQDGGWGTDWGQDRAMAERKALAVCGKHSTTCEVVRRVCTRPGG